MKIGIQLYTVRELLEDGFEETLKALAEMGYEGVEFAFKYGGKSPEELKAFLDETGLVTCGLHTSMAHLLDKGSESYAYAKALGAKYVTTSMCNRVEKDWDVAIAEAAQAGATAAELGFIFTYHNHAQEFETIDGTYALDKFYAETDATAVQAELDTYWIKKGGADPVPYLRKYAGRTPQVHLKDMNPDDLSFTEIGTGLMDLPAIFDAAEDIGAEWVIYEQDKCNHPPLESARISIDAIREVLPA